ncbi:lysozyme-like protein [Meira miltonrushii]|uniref:Lysozyme-like protein n=1 Tax=Meira miltonrushii TaxID=1280837 RepID=A0A316VKF3_9BASI|nr:lysozyme-like protein [Meira miltonrushii]PWN36521.1 lysozyme-like protein [Meira miltonrushii]
MAGLFSRDRKKGKNHHRKKKKNRKHHRKNRQRKNKQNKGDHNKDKNRKDDDNQKNNKKKQGKQRHPASTDYDVHGVLNAVFPSAQCSNPKATALRPNGCISFLNCGIHSKSGWNPPPVKLKDLKILSGQAAAQKPVFAPCKKYLSIFNSIEQETGVPTTVLMSFAMQESSCNKGCTGPNGEIGLMQLTKENCREMGVNPGDAWDPETNIRLGAKQFKQYLDQNNGNVIIAIGMYNGWYKGLTESKARNKQYGCGAQNNLDYLDQTLNAWWQGKDGYTKDFQTYNNLAECGNME